MFTSRISKSTSTRIYMCHELTSRIHVKYTLPRCSHREFPSWKAHRYTRVTNSHHAHTYHTHFFDVYIENFQVDKHTHPLTEEIIIKIFASPDLTVFPWDLLSAGDSVYSRENLLENFGTPVNTCLIKMVANSDSSNYFKSDLLRLWICVSRTRITQTHTIHTSSMFTLHGRSTREREKERGRSLYRVAKTHRIP